MNLRESVDNPHRCTLTIRLNDVYRLVRMRRFFCASASLDVHELALIVDARSSALLICIFGTELNALCCDKNVCQVRGIRRLWTSAGVEVYRHCIDPVCALSHSARAHALERQLWDFIGRSVVHGEM